VAKTVFFSTTPQQQLVLGVGGEKCLNNFDDYLLRVKWVAPGTRKTYCFWVQRFLSGFCGQRPRTGQRYEALIWQCSLETKPRDC
jgi:hypothetical protein